MKDTATLTPLEEGVVQVLTRDDKRFKTPEDRLVRHSSMLAPERLSAVREAIATSALHSVWFADVFALDGSKVAANSPEIDAADVWGRLHTLLGDDLKFRWSPNSAIRVGDFVVVSRGTLQPVAYDEIRDEYEFRTFDLIESTDDHELEAFVAAHADALNRIRPEWAAGSDEVRLQARGVADVAFQSATMTVGGLEASLWQHGNFDPDTQSWALQPTEFLIHSNGPVFTTAEAMRQFAEDILAVADKFESEFSA